MKRVRRPRRIRPNGRGLVPPLMLALLTGGCATNPATGGRMLSLVSPAQEIAMGRESHGQILASFGVYPDEGVQEFMDSLGREMAEVSERPDLPWEFTVLDDPLINAFALPGGFIYMTRGIMVYMNSEAEFAGVLGHEIGHVTARHSVEQISRQQLLTLGAGVGMVLSPTLRANADLLGQSLQLLTLKFGRDDERQSDDLGLRYMTALGYDPRDHAAVFGMLGQVSGGGGGAIPEWQSTHPNPENREQRILDQIRERQARGEDFTGAVRNVDRFMGLLDGMVVGTNPREGVFRGNTFHHPDLAFRMTFPEGWRTQNSRQAVVGVSPAEDALVLLTLAQEEDPRAALRAFLSGQGIQAGPTTDEPVEGAPAAFGRFRASTEQGTLDGVTGFVRWEGVTLQLLAYTPTSLWATRGPSLEASLGSFSRERDPEILGVQPHRLQVFRVEEAMTMEEFLRRYPSVADDDTVLNLNRRQRGSRLEAGDWVKRVVEGGGS